MEKYLPLLQKSPLFAAMVPGQIQAVLHCVGATVREFGAGEYILLAGSPTQALGLPARRMYSVSYTNLDVYKSQSAQCSARTDCRL